MGISFKIFEKERFFISFRTGTISDSDLLSSYELLFENEKYKPGFNEIVDIKNAKLSEITGEGLLSLTSMVEGYLSGKCEKFKTAVLAFEGHSELARIYGSVANHMRM